MPSENLLVVGMQSWRGFDGAEAILLLLQLLVLGSSVTLILLIFITLTGVFNDSIDLIDNSNKNN